MTVSMCCLVAIYDCEVKNTVCLDDRTGWDHHECNEEVYVWKKLKHINSAFEFNNKTYFCTTFISVRVIFLQADVGTHVCCTSAH